jgi:hypothetical protein
VPAIAWLVGACAAPGLVQAQRAGVPSACCATTDPHQADSAAAPGAHLSPPRAIFAIGPARAGGAITPEEAKHRARYAPLASAVLPGTGQALLQQQRFLPYLALEGYAILQLLADSREAQRQRSAYRDLAKTVARAPLSPVTPVGDWEYYERMEHYVESGAYDAQPGGVLDPEPDTVTYNGSVWLLARQTYWTDPAAPPPVGSVAYESAVVFYTQRAVSPAYRWSWLNAPLEQDVFRRTIARSNDAYRRAAQDLAVIIANHVLSTVDAYVTVRLRSRRESAGASRSSAPSGDVYGVVVAIPLRAPAAARR